MYRIEYDDPMKWRVAAWLRTARRGDASGSTRAQPWITDVKPNPIRLFIME
jgi:hypothetical protein